STPSTCAFATIEINPGASADASPMPFPSTGTARAMANHFPVSEPIHKVVESEESVVIPSLAPASLLRGAEMWKPEHRRAADRHGLRYPSDLSDCGSILNGGFAKFAEQPFGVFGGDEGFRRLLGGSVDRGDDALVAVLRGVVALDRRGEFAAFG